MVLVSIPGPGRKNALGELFPPASWARQIPFFSAYVHVPFCVKRCGYCDFNTYTTGFGPGADRLSYAESVCREIRQVADFFTEQKITTTPVQTLYFGGGTPTLLPVSSIARIITELRQQWGIAANAEVTIEANPDTITPELVDGLAEAGVNRVSMGMQSAVPSVLKVLDRTHNPEMIAPAVELIKQQNLQVSIDLIYGTPGESLRDWETSVQAALGFEPHHLSAYSLVIEEGTKMGADLAHGKIAGVDADEQAEKYEILDAALRGEGYHWYEISNWAKPLASEKLGSESCPDATHLAQVSRHNLAYWRNTQWWGFGPGAHSHIDGRRFWNLKHPRKYAQMLDRGELAVSDGEIIEGEAHKIERLMLGLRIASGLSRSGLSEEVLRNLEEMGYLQPHRYYQDRVVLSLSGRLMADYVTQRLLA